MLVNRVNFLRWYDNIEDPDLPDIPFAYLKDRESCGYMPLALPGEAQSFYINSPDGLDLGDFTDLQLNMYRARDSQIVAAGVGVLKQDFLLDGVSYNVYSTYVIPNIQFGPHYLTIVKKSTGATLLTSSYMLGRTDRAAVLDTTTYCRFRHDRFFYNIRYHVIPDFYQQFRLNISKTDGQITGENTTYKEVTTGKTRIVQSYEEKEIKMEAYYFDEPAHDACAVMIKHEYLELNNSLYSFKEGYKWTPVPRSKLGKGEFTITDNSFAQINRC